MTTVREIEQDIASDAPDEQLERLHELVDDDELSAQEEAFLSGWVQAGGVI